MTIKVGDRMMYQSLMGAQRVQTVTRIGIIDHFTGRQCFLTNENAAFYVTPEENKHFNVGNRGFWLLTQKLPAPAPTSNQPGTFEDGAGI